MSEWLFAGALFVKPFLTGLGYAVILPLLGVYLRLRDEWLAPLALAQTAAFGAIAALLAGVPVAVGAVGAALSGLAFKHRLEAQDSALRGSAYVLLLLAGWGAAALLLANFPLAGHFAQSLVDGQLYFVETWHLLTSLFLLPSILLVLRRESRRLLRAYCFPGFAAERAPGWRRLPVFDMLVAIALALAIPGIGMMAAFALTVLPAMTVFPRASHWRSASRSAVLFGVGGYAASFVLALLLDQPFASLLVMVLLVLSLLASLPFGAFRRRLACRR